eukprot:4125-Heterococcus_DN1.PRE.11
MLVQSAWPALSLRRTKWPTCTCLLAMSMPSIFEMASLAASAGEGVVQSLVVDRGVQVLDKDVAYAAAAQGGVALAPHDAARAPLDQSECVERQSVMLTFCPPPGCCCCCCCCTFIMLLLVAVVVASECCVESLKRQRAHRYKVSQRAALTTQHADENGSATLPQQQHIAPS